jgi:hypothetical protein
MNLTNTALEVKILVLTLPQSLILDEVTLLHMQAAAIWAVVAN